MGKSLFHMLTHFCAWFPQELTHQANVMLRPSSVSWKLRLMTAPQSGCASREESEERLEKKMKRTNPESRPSFGHQTNTGDQSNNQINVQDSLLIFRAAAALKRNRVASEDTARTIPDSFNPIKTHLPTAFAPALYSPEHSPGSQVPQINSIFEIRKFSIKNLKTSESFQQK